MKAKDAALSYDCPSCLCQSVSAPSCLDVRVECLLPGPLCGLPLPQESPQPENLSICILLPLLRQPACTTMISMIATPSVAKCSALQSAAHMRMVITAVGAVLFHAEEM